MLKIGRHQQLNTDLNELIKNVASNGYTIFQIFSQPVLWANYLKDTRLLVACQKSLTEYNLQMIIHSSYMINFCHPTNSKRHIHSVNTLVADLSFAAAIGFNCLGVIVHMGKNIKINDISCATALANYVAGVKKSLQLSPFASKIILETGASQGTEVGSKINSLASIYHQLTTTEQDRVYFCIDTCHIWATGYDISTRLGVKQFFDQFNEQIGLHKIACIHFNDSKTKLGSHVDRHADLGNGLIPIAGLKAVVRFAYKHRIPLITETALTMINETTNETITAKDEFIKIQSWAKIKQTD